MISCICIKFQLLDAWGPHSQGNCIPGFTCCRGSPRALTSQYRKEGGRPCQYQDTFTTLKTQEVTLTIYVTQGCFLERHSYSQNDTHNLNPRIP